MRSAIPCCIFVCSGFALLAADAGNAQNKEACQRVEFSEEVLERVPDIADVCQDVISRGGEQYAVIRADLLSVSPNNTLRIRFRNPDGSRGHSQSIRTSPDFRVLVDGKPTRVQDLATGQQLTAYVHVQEPQVALEPAVATATLQLVPLTEAEERLAAAEETTEPAMPETASPLPILAALSAGFLALGAALTFRRRRK